MSGVHCWPERRPTTWHLVRRETTQTAVAFYYRCRSCAYTRLQLGQGPHAVTDATAFCTNIVNEWLRTRGGLRAREGLERDDAVAQASAELWHAFLRFDGRGSLTGFAHQRIMLRLSSYARRVILGPADAPKALAVADPIDTADESGRRRLEQALGRSGMDDLPDPLAYDLARFIETRSGAIARQDRELGAGPAAGAAA